MGVIPIERAKRPRQRAAPAEPASGLFTAPDGVDLYFEDTGGDAPVLFYVYGLGCSNLHWKYPMAHFAAGGGAETPHRQVWMDFRGHGRSKAPPAGRPLTLAALVEDVRALCEHRGIEDATFLGQSMGGSIVLELAHLHPELVRGVVLLASPGRDPGRHLPAQPVSTWLWRGLIGVNRMAPAALRAAYAAVAPTRHLPHVQLALRELIRWYGFNPTLTRTADIDEYIGKIFEVSPTYFYDLAADLERFDVAAFEPPVACPALVIAGGRDQVVPLAESRRLAKHLPRAELFVVQHGSHCPHFDDPGLVSRRIERFLAANGL